MFGFILRPFATIDGIDFDQIERELVRPALFMLGIDARTSGGESGNVRTNIFEALLSADLVLADVSVSNAGVFYQLGIRHALRDRGTVLMAASDSGLPLDLPMVDRPLRYNAKSASASIQQLVMVAQNVLQSGRPDSPVFFALPWLQMPRSTSGTGYVG
jgi:hypothetical protein